MAVKVYQFKCKHCNKIRHSHDESMEFCSTSCKAKLEYYEKMSLVSSRVQRQKSQLKNHILYPCVGCGAETSNRKYCSIECSRSVKNKAAREKTLQKTKETFVKERIKPKYSLAALNRMAEWKRVNDDESWLNRFQASRR